VALVVAIAVANGACLVACVSLHDHGALCFCLLHGTLRELGEQLVHPIHFKFGALATLCALACCVARLDGREILARLHEWGPRLWAIGVAFGICAALLVARMGFLHLLVHLVMPMLVMVTMVVFAMVMPSMVHALAIPILPRFLVSIFVEMNLPQPQQLHRFVEDGPCKRSQPLASRKFVC
jgi:hypothetical protein